MNEDSATPPPDGPDAMFAQVYDRLKRMAAARLANAAMESLDATALVHELYLRMGKHEGLHFGKPEQFYAYAARAMRHLLANRARDRLRLRAGGDWVRITLTGRDERLALGSAEQALAMEEALSRLEKTDARAAQVAELFVFAGLEQARIGETLGISRITVARDWRFAKAFLKHELS